MEHSGELEDGELDDEEVNNVQTSPIAEVQNVGELSEKDSKKLKNSHKRSTRHSNDAKHVDKGEEHSKRKKKKSKDVEVDEASMASYMSYMAYSGYPSLYPTDPLYSKMTEEWSKQVEKPIRSQYDSHYLTDEEEEYIRHRNEKSKSRDKKAEVKNEDRLPGLYDSPSEEEIEFGVDFNIDKKHSIAMDRKGNHKMIKGGKKVRDFIDATWEGHSKLEHEAALSYKNDCRDDFQERPRKKSFKFDMRKKKLSDTPMIERPQCRFFMEGKCVKGDDCPFNHDFIPPRKPELCKFYVIGGCKKEACVYYHSDWPCKQYHETGSCDSQNHCLFSHAELNEETRILPFSEALEDRINYFQSRKQNFENRTKNVDKRDIPSLLELAIYPKGQEPDVPDNYISSTYNEDNEIQETINKSNYDYDGYKTAPPSNMDSNYEQYYEPGDETWNNSVVNNENNYYPDKNQYNKNIDANMGHNNEGSEEGNKDKLAQYSATRMSKNKQESIKNDFKQTTTEDIESSVDLMLNDLRQKGVNQNQIPFIPPIPQNFSLPPPNYAFNPSSQPFMHNYPASTMHNMGPLVNPTSINMNDNRYPNNLPFLHNSNVPPPYGQSIGLLGPPPINIPPPNIAVLPNQPAQMMTNMGTSFKQINGPPTNMGMNAPLQLPMTNVPPPILPPSSRYDINQIMSMVRNTNFSMVNFSTASTVSNATVLDSSCLPTISGALSTLEKTNDLKNIVSSASINLPLTTSTSVPKSEPSSEKVVDTTLTSSATDSSSKVRQSTIDPRMKHQPKKLPKQKISPVINTLSPPCSPEPVDQKPSKSCLEVTVVGQRVEYVLHKMLIETVPTLPEDITVCNPKDPRLKRYRMAHHVILDERDRTMQHSSEGLKKSPRPYSLPDIVFLTTPAAPVLEEVNKKSKLHKRSRLSSGEEISSKLLDSPLKSPPMPSPITPDIGRWTSSGPLRNENIFSSNNVNLDKKPLDYRNDPRYKKKKIKLVDNQGDTKNIEDLPPDCQDTESINGALNYGIKEQSYKPSESSHSSKVEKPNEYFTEKENNTNPKTENNTDKEALNSKSNKNSKPVDLYESYFSNHIVKNVFSSDPFEIDPVSDAGDEAPYGQLLERQASTEEIDFLSNDQSINSGSRISVRTDISIKEMFKSFDPTTSPFC